MSAEVFLVLPTYHRDESLRDVLHAISNQTLPPRLTIVVDNAQSATCKRVCKDFRASIPDIELLYISADENLGPAGATALGMEYALGMASDTDWLMRGDDDSPPADEDLFRKLVAVADSERRADPMLAGVGTSGARFDTRSCRLVKPGRGGSTGLVDVDYLATNHYPLFSIHAVRDAGTFRAELFFGNSEVEFGLRLRRAGYRFARMDLPHHRRVARPPSRKLGVPSWRRFYSLRNLFVIAKEYGGRTALVRVLWVRVLLKPLLNFPREPRNALAHLRLGLRAYGDARRGVLGRTVEPTLKSGQLDLRRSESPLDMDGL